MQTNMERRADKDEKREFCLHECSSEGSFSQGAEKILDGCAAAAPACLIPPSKNDISQSARVSSFSPPWVFSSPYPPPPSTSSCFTSSSVSFCSTPPPPSPSVRPPQCWLQQALHQQALILRHQERLKAAKEENGGVPLDCPSSALSSPPFGGPSFLSFSSSSCSLLPFPPEAELLQSSSHQGDSRPPPPSHAGLGGACVLSQEFQLPPAAAPAAAPPQTEAFGGSPQFSSQGLYFCDHGSHDSSGSGESVFFQDGTRPSPVELPPQVVDSGEAGSSCPFVCTQHYPVANSITYYAHHGGDFAHQDYYGGLEEEQGRFPEELHFPFANSPAWQDGSLLFRRYYPGGSFEGGEPGESSQRAEKTEKPKATPRDLNSRPPPSLPGAPTGQLSSDGEEQSEGVTAAGEPRLSAEIPTSLQPFSSVFSSRIGFPHAEHAVSAAGDLNADDVRAFGTMDSFSSFRGEGAQEKAGDGDGEKANETTTGGLKSSQVTPQVLPHGGTEPDFCYYQNSPPPPVGGMWEPGYVNVQFVPPVQTTGLLEDEGCLDRKKPRGDGELPYQERGPAMALSDLAPLQFPVYAQPNGGGPSGLASSGLPVEGTPKDFSFAVHSEGRQPGGGKGNDRGREELPLPVDENSLSSSSTALSGGVDDMNRVGQPGSDTAEAAALITKNLSPHEESRTSASPSLGQGPGVFFPGTGLPTTARAPQPAQLLRPGKEAQPPVCSSSPFFAGARLGGRESSEFSDVTSRTRSPLHRAGLANHPRVDTATGGFENSSGTRTTSGTEGHHTSSPASSALLHATQPTIPEEQGPREPVYGHARDVVSGALPENPSALNCVSHAAPYGSDRAGSFCPGICSLDGNHTDLSRDRDSLSASPRTDKEENLAGCRSLPVTRARGSDSSSGLQHRGGHKDDYQKPSVFPAAAGYQGRSPVFGGAAGSEGFVHFSNHAAVHTSSPVPGYQYHLQGYGGSDLLFPSYGQHQEPYCLFSCGRQRYVSPSGGEDDNAGSRRTVAVGEEREGHASTALPRFFPGSGWDAREDRGHVLCVPDFLAEARRQQAERVGRQHRQQQLLLQRTRGRPGVGRGRGGGWRQGRQTAASRQRFGKALLSPVGGVGERCDGAFFLSSSSPSSSEEEDEREGGVGEPTGDGDSPRQTNGGAFRRRAFLQKEDCEATLLDRDGMLETGNRGIEAPDDGQERESGATQLCEDCSSAASEREDFAHCPGFSALNRSAFSSSPPEQPPACRQEEAQREGADADPHRDSLRASSPSCDSSCRSSASRSAAALSSASPSSQSDRERLLKGQTRQTEVEDGGLLACSSSSGAQSSGTRSAGVPHAASPGADDIDPCSGGSRVGERSLSTEAKSSVSCVANCLSFPSVGSSSPLGSANISCPFRSPVTGVTGVQKQQDTARKSDASAAAASSSSLCPSVRGVVAPAVRVSLNDDGTARGSAIVGVRRSHNTPEGECKKPKKTKVREKGRMPSRYWNFSIWTEAHTRLWCPAERQRAARAWSLFNKTAFAGVEKLGCPTRDFVHAVVQQLFFLAPLKATLVAHQVW